MSRLEYNLRNAYLKEHFHFFMVHVDLYMFSELLNICSPSSNLECSSFRLGPRLTHSFNSIHTFLCLKTDLFENFCHQESKKNSIKIAGKDYFLYQLLRSTKYFLTQTNVFFQKMHNVNNKTTCHR